MEVQKNLYKIIQMGYLKDTNVVLSEETDLIEDLELDSIEIFQLLTEVEEAFGIQFEDVDLLAENFVKLEDFIELIIESTGE